MILGSEILIVILPLVAFFALIVYVVSYSLSRRSHRVAWPVTAILSVVLFVVLGGWLALLSSGSGVCTILSSVGGGQPSCRTVYWPAFIFFGIGLGLILAIAWVTRPRD